MGPGSHSRFSFWPEEVGQELMGACGKTGDSKARKQRSFKGKRPRAWLCKEARPRARAPKREKGKAGSVEAFILERQRHLESSSDPGRPVAARAHPSEGLALTTGSRPTAVLFPGSSTWGRGLMRAPPLFHSEAREGETDRWQRPKTIFYYEF